MKCKLYYNSVSFYTPNTTLKTCISFLKLNILMLAYSYAGAWNNENLYLKKKQKHFNVHVKICTPLGWNQTFQLTLFNHIFIKLKVW